MVVMQNASDLCPMAQQKRCAIEHSVGGLWLLKIPNMLRRLMFGSSMDTLRIDGFRSHVDDLVGSKLRSVARRTAA
jgi:hypothetical protein